MNIRKEYKFYYAHRNQELTGTRCSRIHGHDCHLFLYFDVKRNGAISTLFNDFDIKIEPFLKKEFDHSILIDVNDRLYDTLREHERNTGEDLGLNVIPFPTSVENTCFYLAYRIISDFGFDLNRIEYQETRSSIVTYTRNDYQKDYSSGMGEILYDFMKEKIVNEK